MQASKVIERPGVSSRGAPGVRSQGDSSGGGWGIYALVFAGVLLPSVVGGVGAWKEIALERWDQGHRSTVRERTSANYVQRRAESVVAVPLDALRKIVAQEPFLPWTKKKLTHAMASLEELAGSPVRARYLVDSTGRFLFPDRPSATFLSHDWPLLQSKLNARSLPDGGVFRLRTGLVDPWWVLVPIRSASGNPRGYLIAVIVPDGVRQTLVQEIGAAAAPAGIDATLEEGLPEPGTLDRGIGLLEPTFRIAIRAQPDLQSERVLERHLWMLRAAIVTCGLIAVTGLLLLLWISLRGRVSNAHLRRPRERTPQPIALQALVRHAVERLQSKAARQGVTMELAVLPTTVAVRTDARNALQSVLKLVEDALNAGVGRIRIEATRDETRGLVRVMIEGQENVGTLQFPLWK